MLARASSDAGTRLRRSKSTTSTFHRRMPSAVEPSDPGIAQYHATAAAVAAFARYQAQQSIGAEASRNVELRRSKSTTSRGSLISQGSHFPPRESSVRSMPTQGRPQAATIHEVPVLPVSHAEKLPNLDSAPSSDRLLSSSRPRSAQPSITLNDHPHPMSQPKSYRPSTASSVTSQQIRKARSMYYASSVQTGSPIARPPAKYLTTPPIVETSPSLSSTPRSYIPSRGTGPSPLTSSRVPGAIAPNETVDNERGRDLQGFQQQTVKHKPSLFLAPFRKRQDRSKDDSKRMSSVVAPEVTAQYKFTNDTSVGITVNDFVPHSDSKDKRSFSGSFKKRIRRVFRRPSSKAPNLPVQQIEARRDYHTNENESASIVQSDIPSPDERLLQRVRSRTPSLDSGHPWSVRPTSRSSSKESAHSIHSLHSDANVSYTSASRVTSWETSASGDTPTQRATKRLTVIHEAKDSIGSVAEGPNTVSMKRKSLPHPAFSAFKDPMHMESLTEEVSTPSIDPRRVFSALMREIDASKTVIAPAAMPDHTPSADSDVFRSNENRIAHVPLREVYSSASRVSAISTADRHSVAESHSTRLDARRTPSKKSSIRSFGHAIRSTIRTVTPGVRPYSPRADEATPMQTSATALSTCASSGSKSDESRRAIFKNFRVSNEK